MRYATNMRNWANSPRPARNRPPRFEVRCVLLVLLLSAFALAPCAHAQPRQPAGGGNTRDLLNRAREALNNNDFSKAVALFDQARARPDFADAKPSLQLFIAAGDHHFAQGTPGDQDAAMDIYSAAAAVLGNAALQPTEQALLRLKRAQVLMRQGHAEQAREELQSIRRNLPARRGTEAYADLGEADLMLLASQPDAARDKLLPLVDSQDAYIAPMAMFSLGRAYIQLKQTDQAVAAFRRLWNRHGDSQTVKGAILLIGQVYFDQGDFLEARKLYEACAVVGAITQTRVRPGDDLIIRVSDPNHFARTRSTRLPVTLICPSGDREVVSLEKNPLNDHLYLGRIPADLAQPAKEDGTLQVAGSDVITLSYGQPVRTQNVIVVDDGRIDVDSVPLPPPPPRKVLPVADTDEEAPPRPAPRPQVPAARQTGGSLNPGSPLHIQLIDADFDLTDQPDTAEAEAVVSGGDAKSPKGTVKVKLTETGPRTGVFAGSVPTAPPSPAAAASSQLADHPASAVFGDPKAYWQGKPRDKSYWLEVDLREPGFLKTLTWGAPTAANAPTKLTVIVRGEGVDRTIPLNGPFKQSGNSVDLGGVFARVVRFEFTAFQGDAPAIGPIIVTDTEGHQLAPDPRPATRPAASNVLIFEVGQQVFARYPDEENDNPGSTAIRESRKLSARYHNAVLSFAKPTGGDTRTTGFTPLWRLDPAGEPQIMVSDPDADTTPQPDSISIEVASESGDRQTLTLQETGPTTGLFIAPLPASRAPEARDNARLLLVRPGDAVWATFLDQRNLQPGYRAFRHLRILDNRPSSALFNAIPLTISAAPPQIELEEGSPPPTAPIKRGPDVGQLSLAIDDGDAFSYGSATGNAKINTLIGNAARDITLSTAGAGNGVQRIELTLGNPADAEAADPASRKLASRVDLPVAGDDILRLSYTDQFTSSSDIQSRPVMDEKAIESFLQKSEKAATPATGPAATVVPTIRLSDPLRRSAAQQDQRLAELKREINNRLVAATAERDLLQKKRGQLAKLIPATAPAGTTRPSTRAEDGPVSVLASLDAEIELLTGRIGRLTTLGAVPKHEPAPAPLPPAPERSEAAVVQDGPIIPGTPFEFVIDDPDLKGPSVDVRVRSFAGRLIQAIQVPARRDNDGAYRARVNTSRADQPSDGLLLSVLPAGEIVIDYNDPAPAPSDVGRVSYVLLGSDAELSITNSSYLDPVEQIRMGEPVYVQLIDFDRDRSAGLDQVIVTARSQGGDELLVVLGETEPHSGVFRGRFRTDRDKVVADDDTLQCEYGSAIEITYADHLRRSLAGPEQIAAKLNIGGGSDGALEAFTRQFNDPRQELRLWYRTGLAAFQIAQRLHTAGARDRAVEYFNEAGDHFRQLIARGPDDPLAASASFYLGEMNRIRLHPRDALPYYQELVARWPKSEFIAAARYQIGQCYQDLGLFDQAADAWVLLTYHHPEDSHVPDAMEKMMRHFERQNQPLDAVAVARKFVERFPRNDRAGAIAADAGRLLAGAEKLDDALTWFVQQEKNFAARDNDMPSLLYWHAATLVQAPEGRGRKGQDRLDKIRELLNRIIFDYPRSSYVALARTALEQVEAQQNKK